MNGEWPTDTLTNLSIDKESARKHKGKSKPVVNSEIQAVDFDKVMRNYCAGMDITTLRSCDALLQHGTLTYLIEFKNREVFFSKRRPDDVLSPPNRQKRHEREEELERVLKQRDLQQELIEKLYDSAIVLDGLREDEYRLIRDRNRLIGFIVVSRTKNYALGSFNDNSHPEFYRQFIGHDDPMHDALAMTSLNTATDDTLNRVHDGYTSVDGTESAPADRLTEYDGWYCPKDIRRLENRLYRKVMFMTEGQFLRFLQRQGITQ